MTTYHVAWGSNGLIVNLHPIIGHESSIAFVEEDGEKFHVMLADPNTGNCLTRTDTGDLISIIIQMIDAMGSVDIVDYNFRNCERMG